MTIHNHYFLLSSFLQSCKYDNEKKELTVTFTSGKDYTYEDVERDIYEGFVAAPSAGKYYTSVVKNMKLKS